jgi:hypothetical protein
MASGSASVDGTPTAFRAALAQFLSVTVPERVDLVKRAVAFDLYGRLVEATPRDTGWAQASWRLTRDRIDLSVPPQPSRTAPAAPAPTPDLAPSRDATATIWITHNLPYITALNDGHSAQAPPGFVDAEIEGAIHAFDTIVRQVVASDGGL